MTDRYDMIRVFKLTGMDVIGDLQVNEADSRLRVAFPAIILTNRTQDGKMGINFMPFLTFADQNDTRECIINKECCMTSYKPSLEFIKIYQEYVTKLRAEASGIVLPKTSSILS